MDRKFEITWIEANETKIMTLKEANKEFGKSEFQEILGGYLPHIVVVEL